MCSALQWNVRCPLSPRYLWVIGQQWLLKKRLPSWWRFSSAPFVGSGVRGPSENLSSWWSGDNSPIHKQTRTGIGFPYMAVRHWSQKISLKESYIDWHFSRGNSHSFNKYFLSTWYMSGTVLGPADTAVSQAGKHSAHMDLIFLSGQIKQTK